MSANIKQVYDANPIISNQPTDLMYFGRSPYGAGDDVAMLYSSFAAQFPASVVLNPAANQTILGFNLILAAGEYVSGAATGGFTGGLVMYPTTANRGSLQIHASNGGVGNFIMNITNASFNQACTLTIPDPVSATSSFLLGTTGATQHVTAFSLQVDVGGFLVGQSTGGANLGFVAYSPTSTLGSLTTICADNAGNYANVLTNASTSAARTWTLPDASGTLSLASGSFTSGSVIFAGTTGLLDQDNNNFFWDNTNNRLGIGTNSPSFPMEVLVASTATVHVGYQSEITEDTDGVAVAAYSAALSTSVARTAASVSKGFSSTITCNAGDTSAHFAVDYYADNGDGVGNSLKASFFGGLNKTVLVGGTSGNVYFQGYSPNIYSSTGDLHLAFDGASAAGNVGIGTNSPASRLEVDGTTTTTQLNCSSFYNAGLTQTLTFTNALSGFNYFNMAGVATGSAPIFQTVGGDANIGMILAMQGTGQLQPQTNNATPIAIRCGTGQQHSASFSFADTASSQVITFPDGSGTVLFAGSPTETWTTLAANSVSAAVNNGYVCGFAGTTTINLPATAAVGNIVAVEGLGGSWTMNANTGQTIKLGTSTTSSAGSLASAAASDNVYVVCIEANTTWRVRSTNSTGLVIL